MDFGFTQDQQHLTARVDKLVQERIARRAAQHDQGYEAPVEDIEDLFREGWLLANLDKRHGGLGYGLYGDDPLSFSSSMSISPTAIPLRHTAFRYITTL